MSKKLPPRVWVIIPAAGIGSRMQAELPKQYLKILDRTILEHTIDCFLGHPGFENVYVGIARQDKWFSSLAIAKDKRVNIYEGGRERVDSVINGLKCLFDSAKDDDWIWVHDAARPCLSHHDIDLLFAGLKNANDGAILAAPVSDTIKRSDDAGCVSDTVNREDLWRALTPQVFKYSVLKAALENCQNKGLSVTDESSAIELNGGKSLLIEGSALNIKVTRPEDLFMASEIIKQDKSKESFQKGAPQIFPRIGSGFDVHAFGEGDYIILGGVKIPYINGLVAHSDGDVLLHALMDALLGALALGDIGFHFPDTDIKWKGADSRMMLRAVKDKIALQGFQISNIDTTIIAQSPKMSPYITQMQQYIAEDLSLELNAVGIKATTTERLGFTGRKEGIACQATVMLVPLQ